MITYEIELPPSGNKIGFNLLDDEYFTIPSVIDKIPNSPDSHHLLTQYKKNVWIVAINGEDTITEQVTLDEIQKHKTQSVKYKFNISIFIRKSYQMTDLEWIWSMFDQVIPVVSHIEVNLPEKHIAPNNIGEAIKVTRKQIWKEALFV